MPQQYKNYVDGHWTDASNNAQTHDINPANTREELGTFPSATREDAHRAIAAKNYAATNLRMDILCG